MESLKTRLNDLSPEKRELLEALLRKKKAAAAAASAIPSRGDMPGPFPLSLAQERLWLVDQLDPGSPAYNISTALRFTGNLRVEALRESLATIVRRHEALRTRFEVVDGQPVQVVDPGGDFVLPVVDLEGLPPERREEEARRSAQDEALRPFDLRRGPVLRVTLLRLARDRHVLLATLHHIVGDGWSLGVFTRELGLLYAALSEGRKAALPPLPIQYADFALWQRRTVSGPAVEQQLAVWRERLAGLDPVLDLPADRPRPARPSGRGAVRPFALSTSLSRDLRALAERQRSTLFTTLLAALFAFLHRLTGREDLCVGTPVAGRRQVEIEGLIGVFVNTLAIRADLTGDPPFAEHLARVQAGVLDAQANQDVPFERVVQEVAPERSASYAPVFQVLFALQNAFRGSLALPGLTVEPLEHSARVTKLDLSLGMGEQEGHLAGAMEHSLDLFDRSTIDRALGQLRALLEGVAAAPRSRLSELPLLTVPERHQLLAEWGPGEGEPLAGAILHGLFAAQAARTPEAVALVHGNLEQTYAELAARAGGLARHLRRLGVVPEMRVAVCLERSPDLIATLLGVLAAGGAYVPIDPAYPAARQALMLEDSGAGLVVTRGRLVSAEGPQILDLDTVEIAPAPLPSAGILPGHLAYIIYTSGSTGRPKGVAIEHRSAVALAGWARERFSAEELSGVLVGTSVCFDLSIFEIFVPLAWGGRLILAENALELPSLPAASEVRLLNTVPSAAAELVRSGGLPASVRTVNLAGEPLPADLAARLYATGTVERVYDLYGPSEDTTYSTGSLVPREGGRAPAIGRSLPGTRAYVLDPRGRPVPALVAGELWLAGAGLARGYLGRPELTAERFVPDPFGGWFGDGGGRAYRTGDLARFRPDGELEFLGRIDHQVKVRGFRIELGEIEEVLRSHASVEDAVVVAREGALAAYVVFDRTDRTDRTDPTDSKDALASWLRERLPGYMVPGAWVVLEALPRTPNGKVDRKALPAPERGAGAAAEHVPPGDPVEEQLAGFWQEVLGVERVGVHDSFFALGGHSLLATQVITRVREAFGVELHPRALFEAPTVAALARAVKEACPEIATESPAAPLPAEAPLSFAQRRLWFLDQLEPGNPAYNIPLAVRLSGDLSVPLLARIFAELVRRHEALRTTFAAAGEELVQVIAPAGAPPALPVVDLGSLPEAAQQAGARRVALEESELPFSLREGPLLRVGLVRLSGREHLLLLTVHHIIADGWSMGVLLREISTLYEAFSQERPSPLPELPLQYADYARRQRSWLPGRVLEEQLAFWKDRLAGAPLVLELPADRPRPPVQTYRGATVDILFPPPLSAAVRELCRRRGVTPFMALLAAWSVLLGRHAGQDDVLVGTPIAGRHRWEVERLIGLFVNTLVMRVEWGRSRRFGELLEQVRHAALDAFARQDLPFERLVEELVAERDLSRSPLFQVMLVLQNTPRQEFRLPGLTLAPVQVESRVSKVDLTLVLWEGEEGLAGRLEHSTDLFDRSTAERFLARFEALLASAAGDPEQAITDLPLLLPAERQQALAEWNDTSTEQPEAGARLHELIAAQAARTPDAVAAVFEDAALTYRELEERAGSLARHLIRQGVEPDGRVGVRLERSLEMIVSLLGILKAGAAYVPLDPTLPAERLDFVVESAGISVVLPPLPGNGWEMGEGDRGGEVGRGGGPGEAGLAYVLYTSGSTGTPKGVMIPHRGIVNRLLWMQAAYSLTPGDRVLQKTPFGFDVSVWEFFWPLLVGARLVFARPEGHKDPSYLVDLIAREGITTLHFVPSMLQAFLEAPGLGELSSLRLVMASGEALPPDLVRRFYRQIPAAELHNLYGPTEASVDVSFWACVPEPPRSVVPIGRPISNLRLYVVDRALQPQPIGVPGELLLGGVGLARGYLGRPELTAAAFVPDPFAGEPGGRLYRTGDLTRLLPDGNIEYLGRIDHQVKIRGFRIELGEIEAVLASHPAVRECVVVAREGVLAAYVVLDRTDPTDRNAALAAWLQRRLPEYMVPSAFVVLEALPLTPNGKVDRKALPAPERRVDTAAWVAPSGEVEERLAAIWAEVLRLDRVGANESFFALGGHSLLATRVVSRVRDALGVDLPVRQLFETPTVAELARVVARDGRGAAISRMARTARPGDLPLSFAQQRLWFLDQLEPDSPVYNIPLAVRLSGELRVDLLARLFTEIIRRHEALRTTFGSRAGQPVQVIASPETAAPDLPLVDLSQLPAAVRDERARRIALEEAVRPFDLRRGPLLRLGLVRLGARDHLLLLAMHHIVSDGWSLGVLLREIFVLYEAFSQRKPSPLPELPVQYADYALWQRSWLQGQVLEEQLAYWKRQLAGAPEVLELPADRPRPPVQTYRGASVFLTFPPQLSAALRELCRSRRLTPFMALLAAWSVFLGRHAGQEDVLVGTPIAGRNRREIEGLIGFFVNTLVMRIDLRDSLAGLLPFSAVLERVRQTALDAYAHQDLPFERVVEELVPARDMSHAPLFQVMLSLQNASGRDVRLPGLTLAPVEMESPLAKLDLTLALVEETAGFRGALEHNTDLFDRSTAARFLARFAALLDAAARDPEWAVADLPLLLPAERHQALAEWNDTRSAYPREASLPELFAAVAAEHPEAPAIVTAGEVWSYRRLDEASSRLARHLQRLGVGPETAVGLCLERSPELILGTVAILKAGGVYVPLDASYPDERLAFMLEDTGAEIVLVHERTRERMEGLDVALVELAGKDSKDSKDSKDAARSSLLSLNLLPDSVAYVIYTSGSTGRPKGVAVPHRAIVRLVRETNYVRLGPGDRTGHVANVSFDAATYEIWGALLTGGAVAVIPRDVVLAPEAFARELRELRVTTMFLTSALFTRMAREAPDAFEGLSELLVGGEAVDPAAARTVLSGRPPRRLLNGYGPTESTTFAAWHPIREVAPGAVSVPIGLPLGNTTLYVLDRGLRLVPPGVAGELLIGGEGLARGYLNRPELTAERFVPHPWEPGGRLYRTGDLVRQRAGGAIEFLGRLDDQVKIRGFRIEPGEIEAVLAGHQGVRECVVVAREDAPGSRRLVAYVVFNPTDRTDGTDPSDLKTALAAFVGTRLPHYMLPSAFVILEALPLTANGKVDRRALPDPSEAGRAGEESFEAPSDPLEELLAGVWSQVLGIERVGVRDSFFALGGHSLLATQVMSRLREVLGVELPLRVLFESPTVAELARAVQAARQTGDLQAPPVVPVPREGDLPLSFAQQRLWFLDRLEPGNPAYNVPFPVRLAGDLPVDRLERIFAELVCRHEALRTTFDDREDAPVQMIAPPETARLAFAVVDLSHLPEAEREEAARRLAVDDALRPFDLRRGPLLRLTLVRLAERDHLLLMTLHHIVSDGWSMGVLLREIAALHGGARLPELPVQYADFAVWQRSWLQGRVLEEQLAHWKRQLAGAPAVLELPIDRPRPPVQTFRGAAMPAAFPPALSAAVRELCRSRGATPFMALLAGWSVLLGRHAGQDDVLVGTPIAGRNRRETEGLIGLFVNTLVLRTRLAGGPGFSDLLDQVRQTSLDAYAHQDLPFERLVEELVPERDLSRSPLFQVMLVLQNTPQREILLPGLTLAPVAVESRVAKFDLTLALAEGAEGFAGTLEHNTDLFDAATAGRLLARFAALLEAAARDPGRPLSELPLLLPAERRQLLEVWNDTAAEPAAEPAAERPDACLHELIAAQAERTPDAVAASAQEGALSYVELMRRARGLAHRLRDLGVGPEDRVGVCLERSLDLLIGLLGVLEAGAAYVPLDPSLPSERLAFLLESAGGSVVITQERLAERLEGAPRSLLVQALGGGAPSPGGRGGDGRGGRGVRSGGGSLAGGQDAHNLAYVLYTSGSTGTPKGVMVQHGSVVNYLAWCVEAYGLAPGRRALVHSSIGFDLTVTALFAPLLAGGEVCLLPESAGIDGLAAALEEQDVHLLKLTPAHLEVLGRILGPDAARRVSTLVVGGEMLLGGALDLWWTAAPGTLVVNEYGPTEATVGCSVLAVPAGEIPPGRVPIGRPIANTRLYVLDPDLQLLPPGARGELFIGGDGLARGYLGRPDLTAERFMPDPCGAPGARLYRTGDLVFLRPDGDLDFLGRLDHQVKIRGFRIELGEIEAVLAAHPAVQECVVIVREDAPGSRRLVAYVVLDRTDQSDPTDPTDRNAALAAWLRRRLPEYMVPSTFVILDSLPLTPNGKVDRKALPAPEREDLAARSFVPPRDELELRLVRIWEDLLGVQPVGVRDNFFTLGGHSLLVVRLLGALERELGRKLPLSALMAAPTVERMAALLRQEGSPPRSLLVPLQTEGERPPLFLVHPVGGNVFCYLPLARLGSPGRPVYGIQSPEIEAQTAPWTLESLAARYVGAVREAQPEGPYLLAGWSLGGALAFEMARQLEDLGSEVALLALIDPGPPRQAPQAPDPRIELAQFVFDLRGLAGLDAAGPLALPEGVETLEDLLAREEIRALLPPDVAEEHLHELFALFRSNRRALDAWHPRPWGGRLTLIRAEATAALLGADVDRAWSELASGGAEIHLLPGDHYSLLQAPQAGDLSGLLEASAGRALARQTLDLPALRR